MIEVKTIINPESVKKFNFSQAKSKLWMPCILSLVVLVLGIIYIIFGPKSTALFGIKDSVLFGVFLIIVALLIPLLYIVMVRAMVNKGIKSAPALLNGTTQIWRFLEDNIIFNESGKYVEAHDTQLSYDAIYKVVERADNFYLFLSKNQAYIIDAKGFTMGSRRELHDLLLNRLGDKKVKFSKKIYAVK